MMFSLTEFQHIAPEASKPTTKVNTSSKTPWDDAAERGMASKSMQGETKTVQSAHSAMPAPPDVVYVGDEVSRLSKDPELVKVPQHLLPRCDENALYTHKKSYRSITPVVTVSL